MHPSSESSRGPAAPLPDLRTTRVPLVPPSGESLLATAEEINSTTRTCIICRESLPITFFTPSQLKRRNGRKCGLCQPADGGQSKQEKADLSEETHVAEAIEATRVDKESSDFAAALEESAIDAVVLEEAEAQEVAAAIDAVLNATEEERLASAANLSATSAASRDDELAAAIEDSQLDEASRESIEECATAAAIGASIEHLEEEQLREGIRKSLLGPTRCEGSASSDHSQPQRTLRTPEEGLGPYIAEPGANAPYASSGRSNSRPSPSSEHLHQGAPVACVQSIEGPASTAPCTSTAVGVGDSSALRTSAVSSPPPPQIRKLSSPAPLQPSQSNSQRVLQSQVFPASPDTRTKPTTTSTAPDRPAAQPAPPALETDGSTEEQLLPRRLEWFRRQYLAVEREVPPPETGLLGLRPPEICTYCGRGDPSSLVQCLDTQEWFCNGDLGDSSCAVQRNACSPTTAFRLHESNRLGPMVLRCAETQETDLSKLLIVNCLVSRRSTPQELTVLLSSLPHASVPASLHLGDRFTLLLAKRSEAASQGNSLLLGCGNVCTIAKGEDSPRPLVTTETAIDSEIVVQSARRAESFMARRQVPSVAPLTYSSTKLLRETFKELVSTAAAHELAQERSMVYRNLPGVWKRPSTRRVDKCAFDACPWASPPHPARSCVWSTQYFEGCPQELPWPSSTT